MLMILSILRLKFNYIYLIHEFKQLIFIYFLFLIVKNHIFLWAFDIFISHVMKINILFLKIQRIKLDKNIKIN